MAVSVVLYRVSGEQVDGSRSPEALEVFNAAAHAMARVVPIYTNRTNEVPRRIEQLHLAQGRFERGAIFFRARDGEEYHHLTVQRRDIVKAIEAFGAAGLTFR